MRKLLRQTYPKNRNYLCMSIQGRKKLRKQQNSQKHVQCKRMKGRHFDKRVKSELALEKELPRILNRDVPITVSALGMWIA